MKIRGGDDTERALEKGGVKWQNGQGDQRRAELREKGGGFGILSWRKGETYSEPKAAWVTGILKAFGIIGIMVTVFYLLQYFGV